MYEDVLALTHWGLEKMADILQMILSEWKLLNFVSNLTDAFFQCTMNNKSGLVNKMPWALRHQAIAWADATQNS